MQYRFETRWARGAAAAWLVIALAACGGGGGSSSTSTPTSPGTPASAPGTPASAPGTPASAPGTPASIPVAALTAPAAFATNIVGALGLSATASDASGIAQVEFQIDGQPVGTLTAAPYDTAVDTTPYASGQHVVRVRATSAAGQVSPWSSTTVLFGGSRVAPAGFTRDANWLTGLTDTTAFAQAPDGRLFVAQQGGTLLVVQNGAVLGTFVQVPVDASGERGLIGVAVHPDFASNGRVYVYYTTPSGGAHNRISYFTASGNAAVPNSETVIANLPQLVATNHNGGALRFGIDGKLYVGVGENAVPSNAQDLSTPLGKLLRLNDDGSIPPDNPFVATPGAAPSVWAYGLRNPYTFAVQAGSGLIHINDVGQDTWEEIDVGAAGANYGWPQSEGPDGVTSGITGPIFAYGHANANPPGSGPGGFFIGAAITGAAFYPAGGSFGANYAGAYFFADFMSEFVARLDTANGNAAYSFATLADTPVDMLVGTDGALYVLTRSGITRIGVP